MMHRWQFHNKGHIYPEVVGQLSFLCPPPPVPQVSSFGIGLCFLGNSSASEAQLHFHIAVQGSQAAGNLGFSLFECGGLAHFLVGVAMEISAA